jgi:hypothetical protein
MHRVIEVVDGVGEADEDVDVAHAQHEGEGD